MIIVVLTVLLKIIMVVRLQALINSYDNSRPLTTLLFKIIMVVRLQPLKDCHDYGRPLTTLLLEIIMVVRLQPLTDSYDNRRPLTTLTLTTFRPGFHLQQTPRSRHKKQNNYMVEQSSFPLIALFWLKIGRCRNWLHGNQALDSMITVVL